MFSTRLSICIGFHSVPFQRKDIVTNISESVSSWQKTNTKVTQIKNSHPFPDGWNIFLVSLCFFLLMDIWKQLKKVEGKVGVNKEVAASPDWDV